MLVDRVVEPAGELAEVLAAAPRIDVGAAEVGVPGLLGAAPGDRDELALTVEHLGLGDEVDVRVRRGGDVGALRTIGHRASE